MRAFRYGPRSFRNFALASIGAGATVVLVSDAALAQKTGAGPATGTATGSAATGTGTTGAGTTVSTGPVSTGTYVPPPPADAGGAARGPESGLPSSSRPLTAGSGSSDGFDLGQSGGGSGVYRGGANAAGVFEQYASRVPGNHVVRRGDTLWDITGYYFRNPWMWPKVWSYNPSIQNPHWIYPGDHVKLRLDGGDDRAATTLGGGFVNRRQQVPANTVFLRDQGYIDDERRDVWGEVSGSPEDRMLLSAGTPVYLEIKKDHEPKKDQELTVFRPLRSAGGGSVVQILGTVRIESWDADKRVARAKVIESLDVIERGARVGPVGRRFDVVPPARNKADLTAHVVVSVHPQIYYSQNQVIFLDKGSDDGLAAGNRLFVLRRGDPWRATLQGSGDLSDKSVRETAALGPQTESVRGTDRDADYPDEVVGELRVLRVREKSATCILTSSKVEIVSGDLAVARKGY